MLTITGRNKKAKIWAIHNEKDYEQMIADVQPQIVEASNDPHKPLDELLQIKLALIEHYENHRYEIEDSDISPLDVLKDLMERHDMTASDLGRLLGDRSLGSRILRGKRELSKKHIQILSERFKVSPSLFF